MDGKIPEDTVKLLLMNSKNPTATQAAITAVETERKRQVDEEGMTPKADQKLDRGELLAAAECYYYSATDSSKLKWRRLSLGRKVPATWPFYPRWWKPTVPERDLAKAGALCLAEVDRIDGLSVKAQAAVRGSLHGQRVLFCLGSVLAALTRGVPAVEPPVDAKTLKKQQRYARRNRK